MRHGSLFSGIGGFDLAAQWMGWENVFQCEKEKFCQQVLNYYWPNAKLHEDIRNTDFTIYRDRIDILTGGFPCQPYSTAGKRLGKEDDRHLWPEMLRAIREISPRWIVGENVRGLINWNGGMVFDEVQADLEASGYQVLPFLLPACAVNAPHRRDRVWFVAHRDHGDGKEVGLQTGRKKYMDGLEGTGAASNTPSKGLEKRRQTGERKYEAEDRRRLDNRLEQPCAASSDTDSNKLRKRRVHQNQSQTTERHACMRNARRNGESWREFPTQSPVCVRNDGIPPPMDGITVSKHRKESLKGYGNAVVPQVVYQIFKAIEQYENEI